MVNAKRGTRLGLFLVIIYSMTSVITLAATQITVEQAKSIAIDAVDSEEVGVITDIELEREDGILVYAVEFTKNGIETDVKIDAETGKIVKIESDKDEKNPRISSSMLAGVMITSEQAKLTAIAKVDAEKVGTITDVELENEDGILVYAIEFTKDGVETDVKINAETGEVVKIESDKDEIEEEEEGR